MHEYLAYLNVASLLPFQKHDGARVNVEKLELYSRRSSTMGLDHYFDLYNFVPSSCNALTCPIESNLHTNHNQGFLNMNILFPPI